MGPLSIVCRFRAFDSIHGDSFWRILRAYGIPNEMVLLIKSFYNNFACQVGSSHINFAVKTGVRQSCVMSAVLVNVVMDWVKRRTTEGASDGLCSVNWKIWTSLTTWFWSCTRISICKRKPVVLTTLHSK